MEQQPTDTNSQPVGIQPTVDTQQQVQQPVATQTESPSDFLSGQQPTQEPAPVSQEPVQQQEQQPENREEPTKFEPTGNKVFDSLGSVVSQKGLDPSVYAEELRAQLDKGDGEVALSEESYN